MRAQTLTLSVLVLLVGCCLAAFTASSASSPLPATGGNNPVKLTQYSGTVRDLGEAHRQVSRESAIKLIGQRLGTKRVALLGVTPSDSKSKPTRLKQSIRVSSLAAGDPMYALWEADLAQGDVAELTTRTNNLRDGVAGSAITVLLPDGKREYVNTGAADVRRGQVFSKASESQVRSKLVKVISRFGLKVTQLSVHQLLDDAVEVRAAIDKPREIAGRFEEFRRQVMRAGPFEGLYVELTNSNDEPQIKASTAYRAGAGRLWISPRAIVSFGTSHG